MRAGLWGGGVEGVCVGDVERAAIDPLVALISPMGRRLYSGFCLSR